MRIQRSGSTARTLVTGMGWKELGLRLQARAARVCVVWARRVRERAWWARVCLSVGTLLALVVLVAWGARAQVHRTISRAIERWTARGADHALAEGARPRSALPSLYLDFDPHAYQVLAMQQHKARHTGILLPQDVVPVEAQVHIDRYSSALQRVLDRRPGPRTDVQVRLAGSRCDGVHPVDQWQPDKGSFEIQTLPDTSFLDMDAFTLRSPALCGYLDGWLYREALYMAGIGLTRTTFVNLVLNGENWGLYALEPELDPGGAAWFESLDVERQGRLLAHADLWGQGVPGVCPSVAHPAQRAQRVFQEDPRAIAAYQSEMARITRPEYLRELRIVCRRAFERYQHELGDEFFSAYLVAPWERLLERQAALSVRVDDATWVAAYAQPSTVEAWPSLPSTGSSLPPIQNAALLPSVEDVLVLHPFLARSDRPGFLDVKPGDWQVAGDLVLPQGVGLWASETFSLRFERGAALVAHGPLILHGPDGAGIHLLPQEDYWAGVRVLRADPTIPSSWRNVEIRGVRGARAEAGLAADQAGMVFYESPIVLERCQVLDSYAPVALSIIHAPFEILDSEFGAASGDLFLANAAQGAISRAAFHDALGAGLRLEGGAVDVVDVSVQRVLGEALLASGESCVAIQGLRADRIDVGVTSAGANVRVRDVCVDRANTAGFLAHTEARLDVDSAMFEDDSIPILVQEGSEATLDGAPVEAQAFAVDELRPPKETSPPMTPLDVRFGPSIWLVGYELTTPERAPGETIEVILYWRAFAYLDRSYTIFMHVRDAAGETVAGWDMMPRYNTFPTTDWPLVERIDDVHIVPLSKDLPPGEYTLALGMYDWATGVRLPAFTQSGGPLAEATVILEERVTVK